MPATRRSRSWLLLSLVGCLLTLGVALPSVASAPSTLRPGVGWRLGSGDFVGFYVLPDGRKVYCTDPGRRAPTAVTLSAVSTLRGVSARAMSELAFVLHTWGDAHTRNGAAVTSQLVNTVVGNRSAVARRARQLPAAVNRTVHERLRVVHADAGPYRVTITSSHVPLPGQQATASVRVLSASGHAVPGVALRVAATDAAPRPTATRTDARGVAVVRYTATDVGPIRLRAVTGALAGATVLASHPNGAVQRMVSWSAPASATTVAVLTERPGAISSRTSCTTACDGHPQVTLHACSAPGSAAAQLTYQAGATQRTIDYPAAATARCADVALTLADGDHVAAQWRFQGPQGWSRPLDAPGAFVVDCPPVPTVTVSMQYDCTQAGLTAGVAAGPHPVAVVVGGPGGRRVTAPAGQGATFTAAASCTDPHTFTVRGAVQRTNGTWNYGPQLSVTTPGPAAAP